MLELENSNVINKINNLDKKIEILINLLKKKEQIIYELNIENKKLKNNLNSSKQFENENVKINKRDDFEEKLSFCLATFEKCLIHFKKEK